MTVAGPRSNHAKPAHNVKVWGLERTHTRSFVGDKEKNYDRPEPSEKNIKEAADAMI